MKSNILLLTKHQMTPQMTQFLFAVLNETNKLFSSETGSSTSIKTSKASHIEIIHSTVKGQG